MVFHIDVSAFSWSSMIQALGFLFFGKGVEGKLGCLISSYIAV